jgi:hypothetical protein
VAEQPSRARRQAAARARAVDPRTAPGEELRPRSTRARRMAGYYATRGIEAGAAGADRARAAARPGSHTGILAAEFTASMLLVIGAPFFSPSSSPKSTGTSSHVFVRLAAVMIIFLVLGFLSAGPRSGRAAAAAGLLVLLGVVMNSAAEIRAVAKLFGAKISKSGQIQP